MTAEEIATNKELFIDCCHSHIRRDGIDTLLEYLEKQTDFYTAPSSTAFHLNEPGGLCRHSLNVFETLKNLYETLVEPHIKDGTSPFTEPIPMESIAIVALLHDLCKTNMYRPAERWKKDADGRWMSYRGYEVQDKFPFGHGEKSCIIIHWFLRLKQDELLAIRWHMGMFEITDAASSGRHSFRAAMDHSPLVSLLQAADLIAANCLERTTRF